MNPLKYTILLINILLCSFLLQCASEEVNLVEITSEKIPDVKKLPPVKAMITEVEEERGEQKYIYIKQGSDNSWFKEGLFGYIFNDVAMNEQIGKFKIVQVYKKFSKGEIIELSYTIEPKAVVLVEVDPRFLIKENEDAMK